MTALLSIEGIHSFYGAAHILHDLSLAIDTGERVAVIGRNGMGKTTIINSLMGVARVSEGRISYGATQPKVQRPYVPARFGVAIVPQGRCIISNLTIEENLLLGAAVRRPGRWSLETVYELFPILKERSRTPGTSLSGGQQQMLAIGRALMANPTLMILDEPTEGLAPVVVDDLADTLNLVAGEGTAILLIEQNLGLVSRTTDRYYAIEKGMVTGTGIVDQNNLQALQKYVAA